MFEPPNLPPSLSESTLGSAAKTAHLPAIVDSAHVSAAMGDDGDPSSLAPTPDHRRSGSVSDNSSNSSSRNDDDEDTSNERPTIFDILENLALPQHFERLQLFADKSSKPRRQRQPWLRFKVVSAKESVLDESRSRVPTAQQLEKHKKRIFQSIDRLGQSWNDSTVITAREKLSFIAGVLNIFISGYLIGAHPEWFHIWYSVQLLYFMPIRYYTYHRKGYHYFLADLCYFVNLILFISIWIFPNSKRLFISSYCLAFGNNAVAIAMWRNSLVFHSLDKVTSLFIHIMPCVTLHCMVHLIPASVQLKKFPAVHTIMYSAHDSPEHYTLREMVIWATVPYAIWQLSYHLLITVRRRDKIAEGRPTSFTWLRKSYGSTLVGKMLFGLPEPFHEPAFMFMQYVYAIITMVPCPLWFWYRWASSSFLMTVFIWATYNGANYYIEVFGRRFQKELIGLKHNVTKWQASPDSNGGLQTPRDAEEIAPRTKGASVEDNAPESTGNDNLEATSLSDGPKVSSREPNPRCFGELRERR